MNKYFSFFLFVWFLSLTVSAQEVEFLPTDWENPAVIDKGQNTPHAFYIPYKVPDDAIKSKKSSEFILLNGKWKFKLVETPEQIPEEFWQPKFKTENWDDITVPSNWQMEGYDPKFPIITIPPAATN
jgi:beta-galactosidase